MGTIGTSVLRREGPLKLTGKAKYIDDISVEGCLYGATIRSSKARGTIKEIQFLPGVNWDEFTIVTAKDIPGKNVVALILDDQPYLADGVVNHPEEPILLLAHADKYILEKAKKLVKIEIDPLPAVFTIEESERAHPVIWGSDNVLKSYVMEKGNVDAVFAGAAHIIEGTYRTGAQEQLYIEPNGVLAVANPQDGVTVWGSLQCPYYVHKAFLKLFPLLPEKIRIVQMETGGGFGGKEEYPTVIAGHAALLAWKSGKPVKIIYDRAEDMVATTKRHPSRTVHRTALDAEGRLLGMDIEFVIDGGAYATLSAVVLSRGTIHAAGPYSCDNVRIRSRALATNTPPHGAFRGFGAPQSLFALERHMDRIAGELKMSPEALRRKNFLKKGDKTATSQIIRENVDMDGLLTKALEKADYARKQAEFKRTNTTGFLRRGMGFATFMHGAGFTGSGEKYLASKVAVEGTKEGRIRVLSASTEIGQGTNTIFSQIAADALGIGPECVEVHQPDTSKVPDSGPTVASRTCMVVGNLVETAVKSLRDVLRDAQYIRKAYTEEEFTDAVKRYVAEKGQLKVHSTYTQPPHIQWDDEKYQGDAYGTYAWAVYVAEVEVDMRTYAVHVKDFVALQEVGRVINPTLAAGQIEGGVAQGIGYAVYEKVVWKEGRMANNSMTNYIMPTSGDLPPIRVFFEEEPYAFGAFGAKGIGELPMDGPGPAILNAVQEATGLSFHEIPLLPEMVFERINEEAKRKSAGDKR